MSSIDIATLFASQAEGGSALIDDKIMSPARVAEQVAGRQPLAALLTALAGLAVAADDLIYANGPGSLAVAPLTAYARQILAGANAAAVKTLLAVASTDVTDATATGRQILTAANAAAVKTLLAVAVADVSGLAAALASKVTGTAAWAQLSVTFSGAGLSPNIPHGLGAMPSVILPLIYGDITNRVIVYYMDANNFILKLYTAAGSVTSGTFTVMYLAAV